jgi:DNA-binding winged helix-turn-helix (wHTH) protein
MVSMPVIQETVWFEDCRLSAADGLVRHGHAMAVEPTVLAVLRYFLEHRHEFVSKTALQQAIWPDVHIARGTIDKGISRLRQALGDSATEPRFIRTIPRRGYRFIATVWREPPTHVGASTVLESATESTVAASKLSRDRATERRIDRSRFVRDVTIPDGTVVRVKQRFQKIWEIKNVGTVPWIGRFLVREGPSEAPGRLRSAERVTIPATTPGETCQIVVELVASDTPGSCYAEWKMTDAGGALCLATQTPLYVSVDVRESRSRVD